MGRNNDYTTGSLLDFGYFWNHYTLIALDLRKQIELENPDLKQQIKFIGRFERNEGATKISSSKKQKKQLSNFHKIVQQLFGFD